MARLPKVPLQPKTYVPAKMCHVEAIAVLIKADALSKTVSRVLNGEATNKDKMYLDALKSCL